MENRRIVSPGMAGVMLAVFLITGMFSALPAAAQEKNVRKEHQLETITVTAQKQEEDIQKVPVNITLLDSIILEDRQIKNSMDLTGNVPNLMLYGIKGTGHVTPSLRGLAATTDTMASSVGMYVDGVPLLGANGFEADLLDIERVEVLHGPQSTLYGQGAEVGVINIITRRPGKEFQGRLMLDGGKFLSGEGDDQLQKEVSLSMSGPIMEDRLSFSLSGKLGFEDGFVYDKYHDTVVDDAWSRSLKGQILWTPSSDLEAALILSHYKRSADGNRMNFTPYGATMYSVPEPEYRILNPDMDDMGHDWVVNTAALRVAYDINDIWSLQSVTSYWSNESLDNWDYDFNAVYLSHIASDQDFTRYSEELRLNFNNQKVKGVLGLYADSGDVSAKFLGNSAFPGFSFTSSSKLKDKNFAIFGNLTWQLTTQWSVNTGLRWGFTKAEFKNTSAGTGADESWSDVSPRLALQYQMTPDNMFYAGISKGFRSGGFTASSDVPYDPETVWSFEFGSKNMFLDNRLMLGASVYYMKITDMQVRQQTTPYISVYTNAAEASGIGAEIEALATLGHGFTINGSFGYGKVTYDDFSDLNGDYKNNQAVYSPEYTYNLGVQYRHDSGFYIRGDLMGYGRMYFDQANRFEHSPYALVNARIGYETDSLDIYIYGKNIFDTEYDYEGDYGGMYTFYSDPGLIGLQMVYRF